MAFSECMIESGRQRAVTEAPWTLLFLPAHRLPDLNAPLLVLTIPVQDGIRRRAAAKFAVQTESMYSSSQGSALRVCYIDL